MIASLQHVLNAASRFVSGLAARADIADTMWSLHWLPVAYQIRCKLCLVMYSVYNGISAPYIAETNTRIFIFPDRALGSELQTASLTYLATEQNSKSFIFGRTTRMKRFTGHDQKHHRSICVQACYKNTLLNMAYSDTTSRGYTSSC